MRHFYWEVAKRAAKETGHAWRKELIFSLLFGPASVLAAVLLGGRADLMALKIGLLAVVLVWLIVFVVNLARGPALVYQSQENRIRELRDLLSQAREFQFVRGRVRAFESELRGAGGLLESIDKEVTRHREDPDVAQLASRLRGTISELDSFYRERGHDDLSRQLLELMDGFEAKTADDVRRKTNEMAGMILRQAQLHFLDPPIEAEL